MKTYSLKDTGRLLAAALLAIAPLSEAHSWPEEVRRIAPNGTLVGPVGYSRGLGDGENQYMLIHNLDSALLYMPQRAKLTKQSYKDTQPMAKAAPGDWVAIQYNENGHVSLSESPIIDRISPMNRGTIYLYGTNNHNLEKVRFADVHLKWTADGTGGDKKGRLLATRHYDDGQCREPEDTRSTKDPGGIKAFRQANFPLSNGGNRLFCQSDIKLPDDLKIGEVYTVIWVWDWPQTFERGLAISPYTFVEEGKKDPFVNTPEIYTGVVDFMIVDPCDESLGEVKGPGCKEGGKTDVEFVETDFLKAAIRAQMANLFMVKVPEKGKAAKAGVDYHEEDIPMAGLIGMKERPPNPIPQDIQSRNMGRQKNMVSSSATQPGSPPFGGVFVTVTSSTALAPAASSAPVSSASQASTSVPTSTSATVSQGSTASAPAGTDNPSRPNGHNVDTDQTKTVWITETTQMPVATIFVTAITTEVDTMTVTATTTAVDTMTTTVAVSNTALNETGSAPKFRRGKGQWGFVNRN
ncbi:hypothetical protein B0T20DRAFT_358184 [Sordaria brevicollis]|uniref:DUF7492 domain-containing protein n=1 Tax=Sordaria brevicollis TaxID=83679 RepID=A0AAE0PAQ2_SORBR|nr:hypothetical protein B0T20DRAFT_358184 [Sordaria brevicollis]